MLHNISIATVYDVIILSDDGSGHDFFLPCDISIYLVDLFKEVVTLNTVSVGMISGYDFFHLFVFHFGNSFMAIECICDIVFCIQMFCVLRLKLVTSVF